MNERQKRASIGIDVGGTKSLFVLFDASFKVIDEIKIKTPKEKESFVRSVNVCIGRLIRTSTTKQLRVTALGIGCAGTIDTKKGIVRTSPNLPALENFSFEQAITAFEGTICVDNDVSAALYGELKLGAAVGYKHVIAVFIGTGIGGAIAVDGRIYKGANGHAGDIGHYLLQPFGPLAGSERSGVLDDVASRPAIVGQAATLALKQQAPHLLRSAGTDLEKIKSSSLAKSIRSGDKAIEELVRSRSQFIGIVLSNLVDFLNPELVLIGGGLTDHLPEMIRSEIAAGIDAHITTNAKAGLRVVTAALKSRAVAAGAAKLAWDHRMGNL